jgi:hypothetical protein
MHRLRHIANSTSSLDAREGARHRKGQGERERERESEGRWRAADQCVTVHLPGKRMC